MAVVTTGAGNPSKYMKDWLAAGIQVIPVVASTAMAKLVVRNGASAVIAEGGESGGHVGELTTMVLVPQVCDVVDVPVMPPVALPMVAAWRRHFIWVPLVCRWVRLFW